MRKLQQVAVCNSARRQVGRFDYYVDPIQYGSPNYYNEIYRYRADGSIECVLAVGKNDVSGVDVKDGSYTMHSGRFEVDGELTEIRRLKLSRDTNGFVTRIEYKKYNGEDGVGVANQCGVYGEDRALDNDGRVISVRFVDKDGNVGMIDDYGVYEIKNDYDEKGQIVSIMYLDKNGDLVNGSEGLALAIFTYDQYGNVLSFRTYDQYSNPMVNRFGISGCDNQYDDKGNKVECLFLGDDFLPFTTSECETCRVRQEFDKYGNVIRTLYCDMDGNPCRNLDGYASVLWTFNKYGRVMSCEFFDEDGHRTENVYGYAKAVNVYDKQLNLIEISYFGTDGCPCLDNRGISKETVSDNLNTKMGELLYFGIDGRPCLNKEGIAGMQIEYGDRRVIRKVTMLGVNREYVVDKQGIQSILYEYDTHGSLHTIMNVSSDGRLQDDIYGAAFYEILNDSDGYALQVKGYNENGDTVSAPDLGKLFVRQLVSYKHERF